MATNEDREPEWQYAYSLVGPMPMLWVVVRLLIAKGIITVDELNATVTTEAEKQVASRTPVEPGEVVR